MYLYHGLHHTPRKKGKEMYGTKRKRLMTTREDLWHQEKTYDTKRTILLMTTRGDLWHQKNEHQEDETYTNKRRRMAPKGGEFWHQEETYTSKWRRMAPKGEDLWQQEKTYGTKRRKLMTRREDL